VEAELREQDVVADPIEQFRHWFADATGSGIALAEATALATADGSGRPAVRMVLLKAFDARGFVFFTNYGSRKADELADNPRAAMCFWWPVLERQVRIEGGIEKVSAEESDVYFATRPREANLGAMASQQSRPLPDRAQLEERVAELRAAWADRELERPAGWGGYRLIPEALEFWQGRRDRLHDRLLYRRHGEGWRLTRLSP
jgi:pyridoxamine 5'-phosphate oxidase